MLILRSEIKDGSLLAAKAVVRVSAFFFVLFCEPHFPQGNAKRAGGGGGNVYTQWVVLTQRNSEHREPQYFTRGVNIPGLCSLLHWTMYVHGGKTINIIYVPRTFMIELA